MSEGRLLNQPSRNRQIPPCFSCRARKLACDRSRPSCDRCRKSRSKTNCIYPEGPKKASNIECVLGSDATTDSGVHVGPSQRKPRKSARNATSSAGYFGYTSHNSIFEEAQLDLLRVKDSTSLTNGAAVAEQQQQPITLEDLQPPLRDSALFVMRCLTTQIEKRTSLETVENGPAGWAHMAASRILRSLLGPFKHLFQQGDSGLCILANILSNNTKAPLNENVASASDWVDQFCDRNIRWESIGILWASVEHISDDVDCLRYSPVDSLVGSVSSEKIRSCLGCCIELARHFNDGNVILVDICRRKAILDSLLDGDSHVSSYASHGLAVTFLTYLGLHALENGPSYQPSFCSENKRRLFAQIFTADKFGVAFTGRPPLLTLEYCSTTVPLDIKDEVLSSDDTTIMEALDSLDAEGWNTTGDVYPSTVIRARYLIAVIREELALIALRKRGLVDLDQLQEIKSRQLALVSAFPQGLKYSPEDLLDLDVVPYKLYFKIAVHLDHLKNIFFAERLLFRHSPEDKADLLFTSFELVKLTTELWMRQNSFNSEFISRDFGWMVLEYGTPGAGILCQELLQPTFQGSHPKYPSLTRSDIVQQLSLLTGFFNSASWPASTRSSCTKFKNLIRGALDYNLNTPFQAQEFAAFDGFDWEQMASHIGYDPLRDADWFGQNNLC